MCTERCCACKRENTGAPGTLCSGQASACPPCLGTSRMLFFPLIQRLKPVYKGEVEAQPERVFPEVTQPICQAPCPGLCRASWTSPGWPVSDLKGFWKAWQTGAGPLSFPSPISNTLSHVIPNSREGISLGDICEGGHKSPGMHT